jgi:hypothetical protein
MSELLELEFLVAIDSPTKTQANRIGQLRRKLFPRETDYLEPKLHYRAMDRHENVEVFTSKYSMMERFGVNIVTFNKYLDTGVPIKQGKNKGLKFWTEGY